MSDEKTENDANTEAPRGGENRREGRRETPEGNRKSLIAFLKSIKFRRGGRRAKVAECDGHFAGLESKVKRRRTQDETLAIRSAN